MHFNEKNYLGLLIFKISKFMGKIIKIFVIKNVIKKKFVKNLCKNLKSCFWAKKITEKIVKKYFVS